MGLESLQRRELSQPEGQHSGGDPGQRAAKIVLHIHRHIVSGLDAVLGLRGAPNVCILIINQNHDRGCIPGDRAACADQVT